MYKAIHKKVSQNFRFYHLYLGAKRGAKGSLENSVTSDFGEIYAIHMSYTIIKLVFQNFRFFWLSYGAEKGDRSCLEISCTSDNDENKPYILDVK